MFVDVMSRLVAGARRSPFRTGVLLVLWLLTHDSAAAAQEPIGGAIRQTARPAPGHVRRDGDRHDAAARRRAAGRRRCPAPVQTATDRDIDSSGALDLSDFLNRRMNGVYVNEVQNNPFQPDVNYRGYTASPLLGTPQGLSVYMDGVRLNQPFGEVVSWDLIPRMALASTTLMPGSNPVFGLNTLGGALSLQTKDGRSHPGTTVQADVRQRRPAALEVEHGGQTRRAAASTGTSPATLFAEDGWRDDSPSDVRQIFGKVGWERDRGDVSVSLGHANNSLTGNGLQDFQLLDRDYASIYTKPDTTDNRSTLLNVTARASAQDRAVAARQRLLPRHPHRDAQRRHQRGVARSVALSARRGRARGARGRRLRHRSRPAGSTRATRRFRRCAASATCCSTTSRPRSATA